MKSLYSSHFWPKAQASPNLSFPRIFLSWWWFISGITKLNKLFKNGSLMLPRVQFSRNANFIFCFTERKTAYTNRQWPDNISKQNSDTQPKATSPETNWLSIIAGFLQFRLQGSLTAISSNRKLNNNPITVSPKYLDHN